MPITEIKVITSEGKHTERYENILEMFDRMVEVQLNNKVKSFEVIKVDGSERLYYEVIGENPWVSPELPVLLTDAILD